MLRFGGEQIFRIRFALFVLCLSFLTASAFAEAPGPKRVLLLYFENEGDTYGWEQSFDEGLRTVLGDRVGRQIELNVEHTDLLRNPSKAYLDQLVGLFQMKYGNQPPDLIIVSMDPYSELLKRLCNNLFPNAKVIFCLANATSLNALDRFPGRATGIYTEIEHTNDIDFIRELLPGTQNLFVISGASPPEKEGMKTIKAIFSADADKLNVTYLAGLPVEALLERVGHLPRNSAIYFSTYQGDPSGNPYDFKEILPLISKNADAPIFSFSGEYMGYGILGGALNSLEEIGKVVGQLTLRIFNGEDPAHIAPIKISVLKMFDWRQLRKWGIDEKRLPEGSIVKYRTYSFFEKYRWRIIFWVSLVIFQTALIAYLMITLGLRKRAEKEKNRLEEALRQAQKMESIGTLAGGIAHDFNNILAGMIGYTELTWMDMEKGTQHESNLKNVLKAGNRAKELINQILMFARKSQEETKAIQIKPVMEDALKFLRSTIPSSVEIQKTVESTSYVMADGTRLQQIILNICTNAVQAMGNDGGVLSVGLSDVCQEQNGELSPGKYVRIRISDTGVGIPREHFNMIFDPYFTTKDVGEGTGLGLSVVHGIVERYNGKITVDSELNRGTTFTIDLPTVEPDLRTEQARQPAFRGGSEMILFVDDEPIIAGMAEQQLKRLGYRVTIAAGATDALTLFSENPDDFDLVITDMAMPRMNGDILAAEMVRIKPDIPIILCTGFSKKLQSGEVTDKQIKKVLMKPISQDELADAIRYVLDS